MDAVGFQSPLLISGTNPENPFAGYISEILAMEGYFCVEEHDLSKAPLTFDVLKDRPLTILSNVSLDEEEIETLKSYVESGGNLIASRPPLELADLFGVKPVTGHYNLARDCYIVIDDKEPLMEGFPAESLQFKGDSEVYEPKETRVLAWLSAVPYKHPNYVAVALRSYGCGRAALFSYDLGETVVTLHQGVPENASNGPCANADRSGMFKTTSLHIKVLDERQKMIPQADLHQDILVRLIRAMCDSTLPLMRVWHFPDKQPALAFINGDSDGMNLEDLTRILDLVEGYGARYTLYLMREHLPLITPKVLERLKRRGHGLGVHPWAGPRPSFKEMDEEITSITKGFKEHFGFSACSTRTHSIIWVGWVESAKYMAKNRLKMDTSFAPGRCYQEGFICGSGLPFKFMDRDGRLIDLYEQATLETDDGSFTSKTLFPPLTQEEAAAHSLDLIDKCVNKYHCVYHPYFHPLNIREEVFGTYRLEKVLEKLKELNVRTVNDEEWIKFNEARRALKVQIVEAGSGRVTYSVKASKTIEDVTFMFPPQWGNARIAHVRVDGRDSKLSLVNWEGGLEWALINLTLREGCEVRITCEYSEAR